MISNLVVKVSERKCHVEDWPNRPRTGLAYANDFSFRTVSQGTLASFTPVTNSQKQIFLLVGVASHDLACGQRLPQVDVSFSEVLKISGMWHKLSATARAPTCYFRWAFQTGAYYRTQVAT